MVARVALMLSERLGCRKGVPAAARPGCKGPPEPARGALIDDGERCSGSPASWRCSRDATTAMTRMMITATAATRGIENQKRFSKVSRDRSRLLDPPFPVPELPVYVSAQGIHAAIDVPFQGIDVSLQGFHLPRVHLLALQLVLALGEAGHLRPPIILLGHVSSSLKGLVMLDREVVPPGAAAFRVAPMTGGHPWKTTARGLVGFRSLG